MFRFPFTGRLSGPLAVALGLLTLAGLVHAQRSYRGMELPPPELGMIEPEDGDKPAEFVFARLVYSDLYEGQILSERPWHIDSPAAERHFLQGLRRLSAVDARSKEEYVHSTDENLFDYPFLYAVEAGHWSLTDEEVERLREYLLRGGFLMLDDFHGLNEWANFLEGMNRIFPDRPIEELDPSNEAFHTLFDTDSTEQIPGVQMLYTRQVCESCENGGDVPHWRGIYDDDGRLMVLINWNMDLGDAWEHADWPEYPERYTSMAYRMAINYITYAMTH